MAKSGENKSGLHKKISSVLKGVPIPQGVHDWQPPEKCGPNKTPNASEADVTTAKISTVFKSVTAPSGDDGQTAEHLAREHAAGPSATESTKDIEPAPSPKVEKPLRPKQSAAKAVQVKQFKVPGRVVRPGQPQGGTIKWPLGHRMRTRLVALKPDVSAAKQKAIIALVPLLAIGIVFVCSRALTTTPQETGAATKKSAPVADAGNSDSEIGWRVPDPLPAAITDVPELPDHDPALDEDQSDSSTTLNVRGIAFSEHKSSAVVGNRIVYVGDTIGDVTIVQISKDSVTFEKAGEKWSQKVRRK